MIGVEVKGVQKTLGSLTRLGREIDAAERRLVDHGALLAQKRVKAHLDARTAGSDPFWGPKSPAAGPWMRSRSGRTMSHIVKGPVLKFHGRYQAAVGSPDKYMALHEVGGTVVGRPWLTIPTGAALTDGGQQKWKTARSAPDTFFLRSKAGKLWIAQRKPKGIELLYLLVHQVNMRPRGIFAAVAKEMDGWMSKEGRQVMSQVVRQANG